MGVQIVQGFLLQEVWESLVREIVNRDDAPASNGAEQARKKVVGAEHHVAVDESHPQYIRSCGDGALGSRDATAAAQIEPADVRAWWNVNMK